MLDEEDKDASLTDKKKRMWVQKCFRSRKSEGEYWTLYKELAGDEMKFYQYFRMSTSMDIEVDAKERRARGIPKKTWMDVIKKTMHESSLSEGQWEDRKQWSLGVGQRRKTF